MDALANLGHGDLLTTEAWQAVKAARAAQGPGATEPLRTILAVVFPLALLAVLAILLMRVLGRQGSGTRDVGSRFTTVLPATAKGDTATSAAAPDRSSTGVTLADVAGCDEAKLELTETIEFLQDARSGSARWAPASRAGSCSTARPAPARRCSPARSPPRPACRSTTRPARSSSRSTSASARGASATCSPRPASSAAASSSSTSSTPSARRAAARTATRSASRRSTSCSSSSTASARPTTSSSSPRRTGSTSSTRRSSGRAGSTARSTSALPDVKGRREILEVHARNKPLAVDDRPRGARAQDLRLLRRDARRPPQRGGDPRRPPRRRGDRRPRTSTTAG